MRRREGFDDAKSVVVKVDAEWNYQIRLRIATPVMVRVSGCYLRLLR
jgi:hypothetical protein